MRKWGEKVSSIVQQIKESHGTIPNDSDMSQAQNPGEARAQSNLVRIDYETLEKKVKDYLEKTLESHSDSRDLSVTDITCKRDWDRSQNDTDLLYLFSEGWFKNFSFKKGHNLSGKVTSIIAVRKTISRGKDTYDFFPDDQSYKIILLVGNELSDERRDIIVKDHINKEYNRPLDIDIKKSRLEITSYGDIYSHVMVVVNNDTIRHLRVSFQTNPHTLRSFDRVEIVHTAWELKEAKEMDSYPFPDDEQIRADAGDKLFTSFFDFYRNVLKKNSAVLQPTSGIRKNTLKKEPFDVREGGFIKFAIKFEYRLGNLLRWHKFSSARATISYQYDSQRKKWNYKGIEVIRH